MAFPVLTEERQVYPHDTARVAAHGEFVNRASQPATASTYLFHDGFRPDGRALQLDRRLPQRASEAWRSLQKSDRAIAADLNIGYQTVGRARKELTGPYGPVVERTGLDGKTRRLRITDDPDIDPELANEAAATSRRRIFLRCAGDATWPLHALAAVLASPCHAAQPSGAARLRQTDVVGH